MFLPKFASYVFDVFIVTLHERFSLNFWPIEHPINRLMSRLVETGMVEEIKRRSSRQIKGVAHTMVERVPPLSYADVTLHDVYFIFIVGAIGLALGCVVFVGELLMTVDWSAIRGRCVLNNPWKLFRQCLKKGE